MPKENVLGEEGKGDKLCSVFYLLSICMMLIVLNKEVQHK